MHRAVATWPLLLVALSGCLDASNGASLSLVTIDVVATRDESAGGTCRPPDERPHIDRERQTLRVVRQQGEGPLPLEDASLLVVTTTEFRGWCPTVAVGEFVEYEPRRQTQMNLPGTYHRIVNLYLETFADGDVEVRRDNGPSTRFEPGDSHRDSYAIEGVQATYTVRAEGIWPRRNVELEAPV